MSNETDEIAGMRVYRCPADGVPLHTERDATDLISAAREHQANFITIPAGRLAREFFQLSSGIAGTFIQKFVTYGVRVAILGDISEYVQQSSPLRDFVYEANRGKHVWFLESPAVLEKRLQSSTGDPGSRLQRN